MLGEGFDLPQLKIAAIHDPHKSLGVTLQFVGRFARTAGSNLGDATVVVGRPERDFDPQLRRLFAEDADWNLIIRDLSEGAVADQQEVSDFEAGFGSLPDEVAMRSLLPRLSTVVYRTSIQDWEPTAVLDVFPADKLLTSLIAVNQQQHVAWFVTERRSEVKWGELHTVEEVSYDLYVLYWDNDRQLLYINSSNTDSHHEGLGEAVGGGAATRITGENVYRVMAQVKRLVPTNVGLLDVRNRSRRFSMHVGADVTEGFPVAEAQTKTKTNIFAHGYEDGTRVSIGASLKGRVWSYRVASTLKEWVDWCDHVGTKLTNDGISVDEVMRNFIRPKVIEERPPYVVLGLEWPWQIYLNLTEELRVQAGDSSWPIIDTDLRVVGSDAEGPVMFQIASPDWTLDYTLRFGSGELIYTAVGADAEVMSGRKSMRLSEFFNANGLTLHLDQDGTVIPPGLLLKPDRTLPPFDTERLTPLHWNDVKLNVESQGPERRPDSIQAHVIRHVAGLADWAVILDDDGTGEIADVVAMRVDGDILRIHLSHCKYVTGGKPRNRSVTSTRYAAKPKSRSPGDATCLVSSTCCSGGNGSASIVARHQAL